MRAARRISLLRADPHPFHCRDADDLTPEKQANLQKALELAEDLGATVVTLDGRDIAETLATFAREQRVTQMVIGHPQKSHWEEMVRGSTVNRILRLCRTVDILVLPTSE